MTDDDIKRGLEDRNLRAVSRATGLHYNTLYNLRSGSVSPNIGTRRKLEDYLSSASSAAVTHD